MVPRCSCIMPGSDDMVSGSGDMSEVMKLFTAHRLHALSLAVQMMLCCLTVQ